MVALTAVEQNPPLHGQGGWGETTDPPHHKLYKERMMAEFNENLGIYATVHDMIVAKGPETAMEKLVKSQMPYDDGWDFDYTDKLLYGSVCYVNQGQVGSCVGAGSGSAVASKIASEILILGDPENPLGMDVDPQGRNTNQPNGAIPFIGYHYGCAKTRDRWNGTQFTGRGWCDDGSYCSIQIWAFKVTGVLPQNKVKNYSKGPQSDDVRSWGCNRNGELNAHLEFGMQHLMKDTTRVQSADDLMNVVTVLKQPCMICSSWGFAPDYFVDGLGWVYKRSGSWSHNMSVVAVVLYKGKWYVKVRNQWGVNAHKDGWHFYIPLELFGVWVRQAECQSIGDLSLVKPNDLVEFPF